MHHSATQRRRQPEPNGEALSRHTGEARPEGPRAGGGVLKEGAASPFPNQLGVWRSAVTGAEGFSCILCRHIASLDTSVRAVDSLSGTNTRLVPPHRYLGVHVSCVLLKIIDYKNKHELVMENSTFPVGDSSPSGLYHFYPSTQ